MSQAIRFVSVVPAHPKYYTGCEHHRQQIPHEALDRCYPVEIFQIESIFHPPVNLDGKRITMEELIKSCDFVHFGRLIDSATPQEHIHGDHSFRTKEVADLIHSWGKPIVLDLDDYWNLSSKHLLRSTFKQNGQNNFIRESVQLADHITVTTDFLKDRVYPFNKSVSVIPNALDPTHPQWRKVDNPDPKGRMRFGWIGGSCHVEDFEIMSDSVSKLWHDQDMNGKFQIVLGGFNVNDHRYNKIPGTGKYKADKVANQLCIYPIFERMLTDNYRAFNGYENYKMWLQTYSEPLNDMPDIKAMPYHRNWAVDTFSYGQKYNNWDVTFIPLNDNEFNNSKSQLKMIESGFMGKACIVSGVLPYTYDARHMENAWVIPPNKNHKGWHKAMRAMINDRAMVKELSENLEREMKEKYNIETVNEKRWECFCRAAGKPELITVKRKQVA